MENQNDVPEGYDPAADEAGRRTPATPASEVPEFLKGPDPDAPEDSEDAPAGEDARAREPRPEPVDAPAAADESGMDRDTWESEFSAADTAGPADRAPDAEAREPEAPVESVASADTTAYPTTDQEPAHTRALPAWDQDAAAAPQTQRTDAVAEPAGDRPAETERDHEPIGATAVGSTAVGAGVGAGAGAAAGANETRRTDAVAAAKREGEAPQPPADGSDPKAQRRQNAREAALTAKPVFARIVQTVLAIFFPFLLLIGAIRAVASPWFLWLDYHRPGFPADSYGFSPAERLTYGNYGVDYINNSAPSSYLGNLVDGKGNPLFLGTEVSHMADVKAVIGITYAAGIVMAILAVIICLYLGRRYAGGIRRAFFAGSVITLVIMIALTVLAVLNFETFFTDFHELFFAQGNWTFHANDTLIRLYPTQFWMDAGVLIAGLVLVVSLVFLIANWPTRKRRDRARLRQSNRDLGLD
ncbi:hypothetical protein GCM10009596_05410 [Arthrobacter rhombi]|uniref:TIGR01906 family membrane protein n=1 Tax=Arthrobacter rhombi TaxID=71253 RepID=UPI0031DD43EE